MKPHSRSPYPKKLREAAIQEVASAKTSSPGALEFDNAHDSTPRTHDTMTAEQFDRDNWVARYPGQNSPHIGNGAGGVR